MALQAAHDALIRGRHFGVDKTYCKVTEHWWWPGVYLDTRHYVILCDICGQMRRTNYSKQTLLESITISETFEIIGMDIYSLFPVTSRENQFILAITDHLSKWAIAVSMIEITTKAIAEVLVN